MATGDIFTTRTGDQRVVNSRPAFHADDVEPSVHEGWREESDGTRLEVTFYDGFGWLSKSERFKLRQEEPRVAP